MVVIQNNLIVPKQIYIYITRHIEGLKIINVTDPFHPELVDTPLNEYGDLAVVDGQYLYLAGNSNYAGELYVMDVSNPATPQRVGLYKGSGANSFLTQMVVAPHRIYLTDPVSLYILGIYGHTVYLPLAFR